MNALRLLVLALCLPAAALAGYGGYGNYGGRHAGHRVRVITFWQYTPAAAPAVVAARPAAKAAQPPRTAALAGPPPVLDGGPPPVPGEVPPAAVAAGHDAAGLAALRKHCAGCHQRGVKASGGVTLTDEADGLSPLRRGRPLPAAEVLATLGASMPPPGRPAPSAAELDALRRLFSSP